jgi:ATP phosphoribosyltransferase regulatory subunit
VVDNLLTVTPPITGGKRLWVPYGTPRAVVRQWQSDAWTVIVALAPAATGADEARRLSCSHYLDRDEAIRIKEPKNG